jgi:hypothetical protein
MDIEVKIPSVDDRSPLGPHEARRSLDQPSMTHVGCVGFIRELSTEPFVHAGLIRAVVRAFLAAALRGSDAHSPDGWRSVIQDLRYVLGSAIGAGVEDRRPVHSHEPSLLPVLVETRPSDGLGLPVQFIHALVRAHVAARMGGNDGTTPESRSRILRETRELVWDGMLDAVKQVPCPVARSLQGPAPTPRRIPPG